jgi:protein kinase-like protein
MDRHHSDHWGHDQRLDAVVTAYLKAAETGPAPNRQDLLARYAEFAAELAAFFADQDQVDRVAAPLRDVLRVALAATPRPEDTLRPDAAPPDRSVGDYDLQEPLGRGGMGVVYRARHRRLNRLVTLKMIRAHELGAEPEVQRFRVEAEIVARLDHPHIVPLYEVGSHADRHYFSMKLIDGGSPGRAAGAVSGRAAGRGTAAGAGGAGGASCPPARRAAPRPEAVQHPARRRGPAARDRLRPGQARGEPQVPRGEENSRVLIWLNQRQLSQRRYRAAPALFTRAE